MLIVHTYPAGMCVLGQPPICLQNKTTTVRKIYYVKTYSISESSLIMFTFSWQNLQYFVLISKVNQFAADATELIRIFSELFELRRSLLHALLRFNVYPVEGTLARYFGPLVFREKKPTRSPDSSLVFVLNINSVPQRYINIC